MFGIEATVASRQAEDVSTDATFEVLSNQRRRFVLHYLLQRGEAVELRELSEQISAWECGVSVSSVTHKQRKRVYTALRQSHLPKLEDVGIVEYDNARGVVEPTDAAEDFEIYVDVVAGNEIPWSEYYLGLGVLSCLLVVATAVVPVPPFSLGTGLASAGLVAALLTVSAAVHTYYSHKRRLGSTGPPPELRQESELAETQ